MQALHGLVFLAACTSHPPDASDASDASEACGSTLADYCSQVDCNRALAEAEQDLSLCTRFPATEASCGGYDVILKNGIDTGIAYYYRDRNLVAVRAEGNASIRHGCIAGPARFDVPDCGDAPRNPLAACSANVP
jgi:hypothetical protein